MTHAVTDTEAPKRDDYRSDPLMLRASIVGLATLVLDGVVAFVPSKALTPDQRTIVVGLVSVAGTMVAAWWARRHVYSPETVQRLLVAAKVPSSRNGG